MENIYEDDAINIHVEAFNKDFDEIGFDPIEEEDDDYDEEAAELYGYK